MKKAIALVIILAMMMTLVACGSNETPGTAAPSDAPAAPVKIKVNSFLTESSPLTDGTKAIVENINNYTEGSIVAEGYYNGNLIGFMETWEAISNGTIDIGYVAPVVMDSYSVLTPIFSIPTNGLPTEGPIALSDLYNELINQRPEFAEEFAKSNLKIVWVESLNGQGVHTKGSLVTTPEQAKGLAIEALGKTTCLFFEELGCTAISLDVGDYYTSLERGIIDSLYGSVGEVYNNQLHEILDCHTIFGTEDGTPSGAGISTGVMMYCMNLQVWNSLTAEQQEQLVQACKDGSNVGLEKDVSSMYTAIDEWNANGHQIYYCWGDEAQAWVDASAGVREAWIKTATEAGYDAQGIWDTWQQILADYNA